LENWIAALGKLGIEIVNGVLGHCILAVAWSLGVRRVSKGGAIRFIYARVAIYNLTCSNGVYTI
jgi:hypothetical protein